MSGRYSLPVRHVWERRGVPDTPGDRTRWYGSYTATPSPGLEWVEGHTTRCIDSWSIRGLKPEYGGMGDPNPPCICGHDTQTWVAVPRGAVGVGLVKGGSLHAQGVDGGWVPQDLVEPWREAWEALRESTYVEQADDPCGDYPPANGLIFLCEREEECPGEGTLICDDLCNVCHGTGTLRRWVLERGACTPDLNPDFPRAVVEKRTLRWPVLIDTLLVFPSPESRDAGWLDDAGQIERRYLAC